MNDAQKRQVVIEWLEEKIRALHVELNDARAFEGDEEVQQLEREIGFCERWRADVIEQQLDMAVLEQRRTKERLDAWIAMVQG